MLYLRNYKLVATCGGCEFSQSKQIMEAQENIQNAIVRFMNEVGHTRAGHNVNITFEESDEQNLA